MVADIEQTMGYTGEAEAFLRVTCGDLCETVWFPISDKVSDQMVDKIISTINTQTADEIERLRRVEKAARYYLTAVSTQYLDNLDCVESIEEAFRGLEKALEEK